MRVRLWIPLLAAALGITFLAGFATGAIVSDSGGAEEQSASSPDAEASGFELPLLERPFLGVLLGEEVAGGGVRVRAVVPGSPAAQADIRVRDVIVAVDGQPVETTDALVDSIRDRQPGDRVTLEIQRDSRPLTVKVELAPQRGLGPLFRGNMAPGRDLLDDVGPLQRLRELLPGLDLEGLGLEQLLRRFVRADVTVLTDDGEPTTLHLTAGTVRSVDSERLVLTPHGGELDVEFDIDGETRIFRGFRHIGSGDIETGETAVVLTRDDEPRARAVFVLPAP